MLSVLVHLEPALRPHLNAEALLQRQPGTARVRALHHPLCMTLHSCRGLCGEVGACREPQESTDWLILRGSPPSGGHRQVLRMGIPRGSTGSGSDLQRRGQSNQGIPPRPDFLPVFGASREP